MAEDDARTRLAEAALDLFGRNGVARTSTRDILSACGMKNPSAISYHFGSKAELVDDLVRELLNRQDSVLLPQIELAKREAHPRVEDWAALAVDWSLDVVSTERGCLLARLFWEYDGHLKPAGLEEFLASDRSLARDWKNAVLQTFPSLPPWIALARNVTVLRSLEWMMARKASENLSHSGSYWHDHHVESRPVLARPLRRDPHRAELPAGGALATGLEALTTFGAGREARRRGRPSPNVPDILGIGNG